jgi:uncharacterized protein DUF6894
MENLMPRFYFNLASKDAHISDDSGKELATLNDAYEHAQKLIHKILFHVGRDDVECDRANYFIEFLISEAAVELDQCRSVNHSLKSSNNQEPPVPSVVIQPCSAHGTSK